MRLAGASAGGAGRAQGEGATGEGRAGESLSHRTHPGSRPWNIVPSSISGCSDAQLPLQSLERSLALQMSGMCIARMSV